MSLCRRLCISSTGATFAGLGISSPLVGSLAHLGVHKPNSVQTEALRLALAGRSILLSAQTGSGKTFCQLLPILNRFVSSETRGSGRGANRARKQTKLEALVVVPTRELAIQHVAVARALLAAEHRSEQLVGRMAGSGSDGGASLLVGTAAQVLEGLRSRSLCTSWLRAVAIDEVDAVLLPDGSAARDGIELEPEAAELLGLLRSERSGSEAPQFLLATAHLTTAQAQTLSESFPEAARVVQNTEGNSRLGELVPTLRQVFHYFRGGQAEKDAKLLGVLERAAVDPFLSGGTTLVFVAGGAAESERLHALITLHMPEQRAVVLHDELEDGPHEAALAAFQSRRAGLLVCTEVAARGLDFPALRHVVMYDMVADIPKFVHCAGRTARRGEVGVVTCLAQSDGAVVGPFRAIHALQSAPRLDFE